MLQLPPVRPGSGQRPERPRHGFTVAHVVAVLDGSGVFDGSLGRKPEPVPPVAPVLAAAFLHKLKSFLSSPMPSYPTIRLYLVARLEPPMDENEVALVLPEAGELTLLEQDGQAARDYARESLAPATRRAHQGRCGCVCSRSELEVRAQNLDMLVQLRVGRGRTP